MAENGDSREGPPKGQKPTPPPLEWPDGYPPGCPPPDAVDAAGEVYRVVNADPPTAEDFRPWRAENPLSPGEKDKPSAWGTSVFGDLSDALQILAMKSRVKGVSSWHVALGTLKAEFGKMSQPSGPKARRPSHRDWWIPKDVDPSPAFAVVKGTG